MDWAAVATVLAAAILATPATLSWWNGRKTNAALGSNGKPLHERFDLMEARQDSIEQSMRQHADDDVDAQNRIYERLGEITTRLWERP